MNWLQNAIEQGKAARENKHCYISAYYDKLTGKRTHWTLMDYETGYPVLGPFANQYGAWKTIADAHRCAKRNGYRCSIRPC